MSAARLILLPLFVIDVTTLAQAAVARATEKLSIPLTATTKLGDASSGVYAAQLTDLSAIGLRKHQGPQIVLAAEEESSQESAAKSVDSKIGREELSKGTNEKSAALPAASKASAGEKGAASSRVAQPAMAKKPNTPVLKLEEQKSSAEKPPSILQMLEGHEPEMLGAAAIALAFFFIGWICGGNYYLRRDRRQRTKLRF